MDMLLPKRIGR